MARARILIGLLAVCFVANTGLLDYPEDAGEMAAASPRASAIRVFLLSFQRVPLFPVDKALRS
jgi:hypothetical protein